MASTNPTSSCATVAGRPMAVMSEMKVSQEDVRTRAQAWRGVSARTTSRFMANRALSRGAKTNGAVYGAPGGSRHRLYHRLSFLRREEAFALHLHVITQKITLFDEKRSDIAHTT